MGFFNNWPYTNFHELNLDWLLSQMKALGSAFDAFVETNILKYSDPIAWSITSQYEPNTIVSNGTDVYLSKQAVPAGVAITNTDYWFQVGDLSTYQLQLDLIRHQIAADDEGSNVNASQSYATGDVFWLNGYLSRASQTIAAGAPFVMGSNYDRVTVIDLFNDLTASVNSSISSMRSEIADAVTVSRPGRKRVICIGDSISQGYTPDGSVTGWPELLRQALGLASGVNFYYNGLGGAGIIQAGQGKTFIQLLQDLAGTVESPETISDIYMVGGVNDAALNSSQASYETAVRTFCEYCATTYPNAVVHIGCIAMDIFGTRPFAFLKVHAAYKAGCTRNAIYCTGLLSAICVRSIYASDGLHMNSTGQSNITKVLLNEYGLNGYTPSSYTVNTDAINSLPTFYFSYDGDSPLQWWNSSATIQCVSGQVKGGGQAVRVGKPTETRLFGLGYGSNGTYNLQSLIVPCSVVPEGGGDLVPAHAMFYAYNDDLYMKIFAPSGSGYVGNLLRIFIIEQTGSVPLI